MKILVSGSTGMVGSELYMKLIKERHDVFRLVRSVPDASGTDLIWDPSSDHNDPSRFEGFDAVVHLAGDNIACGRWTVKKKEKIRQSRVIGTSNLAKILAGLKNPPKVLIVASAIGFYGDRGEETLDEQSKPGTGFLPEVCQAWEAATKPAADKGIRVVNTRFGIILSRKGGALKMMLIPFKLGVGGILGSGKQYMSWIALDDVIGVLEKALQDTSLQGPVNVVSPEPVTNAVFTHELGNALSRPTVLPVPAFGARLVMGEMADALLLASERVLPKKLQASGYSFKFPKLAEALKVIISR